MVLSAPERSADAACACQLPCPSKPEACCGSVMPLCDWCGD